MNFENECMKCKYKWRSISKPVSCISCGSIGLFSNIIVPNAIVTAEPPIDNVLPSYGETQPTVATTTDLTDCRSRDGMATGCNSHYWTDCKYGKKPKNSEGHCWYYRFGLLCDKVTLSDGTEVN